MFKIAMIQMRIESGKKTHNLKPAENMIEEAVQNKADVLL
jgi:predicted amidohydrolase